MLAIRLGWVLTLLICCPTQAWAQPPAAAPASPEDQATEQPPDPYEPKRVKIREAIDAYVDAFNARDVDGLLALWAPNGVYEASAGGDRLTGHEALRAEFTTIFDSEDVPQLSVTTQSIEFISPHVALERGIALTTQQDSAEQTRYRVVYVEREGQWLIDRISEDVVIPRISHYGQLRGLEFLVGQWVSEGEGMLLEIDCQWTANQNFLSRKFALTVDGVIDSSGLQIIGWDPQREQIRSWLFDSNGTRISGIWRNRDGQWTVQSTATFADGSSGSSTSRIRLIDDDTITLQKVNRVVSGKVLPNTDEIELHRR